MEIWVEISHDVVAYIDAHYRTIPDRMSRGLAGHSMGGYGASRIGMKHPDVFGSLYIMSPCCMSARPAGPANPELEKAVPSAKTPADTANLPFFVGAQLGNAAKFVQLKVRVTCPLMLPGACRLSETNHVIAFAARECWIQSHQTIH